MKEWIAGYRINTEKKWGKPKVNKYIGRNWKGTERTDIVKKALRVGDTENITSSNICRELASIQIDLLINLRVI